MDAEQVEAATKIAAAKRGQKARRHAEESRQAASKVAAVQRSRNERKKRRDEEKSAIKIQSRARGRRARSRTLKKDSSQQRYFTPAEVAMHSTADDCWVSVFRKIINLTPLIKVNPGHLVQPLIDNAGTDITHWFDPETRDVRTYIDPKTQQEVPFTPMGTFIHCPPNKPTANWSSNIGTVWWKDSSLVMGKLTQRTRRIKLENMLTKQKSELEVCSEETLEEIQKRYLKYNSHSASYTWKRTDTNQVARLLDMRLTLEENGIPHDADDFEALNIDPDFYIPTIQLYFSDDLTVA
ncbi:hypothetical protein AB1Y20_001023 [Prymnesium parvum]|uniref:Cytochrome b5 domain-containing protein 1 n=1 Tax=Prymnesium parvum TaxID=97485 RepID=A0AB34KBE6_PRYPA